jgi:hypothetical protein
MLKAVKVMINHFEDIYVTEFTRKNFRLRIVKNPNNNISLGYLYGLLEDLVINF